MRKAEAIIAAEKGLNAECRRKLQTLSDHLKLPPVLFDEALMRLQQGNLPTAKLTHYEKAFVKFLDRELKKINGDIVSPRAERLAIALAKSRYGINGTRAEELITARSEAAGMSLISPLEAEAFAVNLIADRIGGRTVTDDEMHRQLNKIGRRWGLGQTQVSRIVVLEIARNKAQQKPRFQKLVTTSLVILSLVAVLMGTAFTLDWIPKDWLTRTQLSNAAPTNPNQTPAIGFPTTRLPHQISESLNEIRRTNVQLSPTIASILSDSQLQQQSGYQELVRTACSERDSNRVLCSQLIGDLFFVEPDRDSAFVVLSTIEDLLAANFTKLPSVQNLKNAYQANQLLGQLKFHQSGDDSESELRRIAIDDAIEQVINIRLGTVDSLPGYLAISNRAISTDQWNLVMRAASSYPTQAAVLLQPLYELTDTKLDTDVLNAYRDDTLALIMTTDASRWRVLQPQILRSLESCDEAKLIEWVSIFEGTDDDGLKDLLAKVIVTRADIHPKSQSREDLATAIRIFGQQTGNQALRSVIDRDEACNKFFAKMMELDSGNAEAGVSPDRIAQFALAVNVFSAFCAAIDNTTHIDDSSFAKFDRLISTPPPRLRQLISLPSERQSENASGAKSSATASDRRGMNASLERLRDVQTGSTGNRINAIKQLTKIAHRFDRISYLEAEILAHYFLSDLELEELLNAEQLIEAFAHWPNLPLAISDQLPGSDVEIDQVLTITRLLLNRNFEIGKGADWKLDLQFKILAAVSHNLENQIDRDPNNVKSNWIRLKIYLAEVYRERHALISNRGYIDDAYPLPHLRCARIVEAMSSNTTSQDLNENIKRAIRLVHSSPANEIEKTAFANQLIIQSIVDELSNSELASEAELVLKELSNVLRDQSLAGDQLYATELALLKSLNLKRKSLVRQLLRGDK